MEIASSPITAGSESVAQQTEKDHCRSTNDHGRRNMSRTLHKFVIASSQLKDKSLFPILKARIKTIRKAILIHVNIVPKHKSSFIETQRPLGPQGSSKFVKLLLILT